MYKAVEKICTQCNKSYLGAKNRKYCSYNCAKKAREKKVKLICFSCSKEFETQEWNKKAKFCSFACKVKSQTSEEVDVICNNCKKTFKRKLYKIIDNNYCSKSCANQFNKGCNHYEYKEHLHDKNFKLACKQWSLKIRERDQYTCQLCGNTDKNVLEAHHIKEKSKFPEVIFDFNNGITLCLKCHALQHLSDRRALRLIECKIKKYYG